VSTEWATLLPSPDEVRCTLCLDLTMQVRGLVEAAGLLKQVDEPGLVRQLKEQRDQHLLQRLQQVIPLEDLTSGSSGNVIDLEELSSEFPFVYVIWVMVSATELASLADLIKQTVEEAKEKEGD
jgi:hypothetical protein